MRSPDKKLLRDGLCAAYPDYDQLARLLDLQCSRRLAGIAAPGPLPSVDLKVINEAERAGWTVELVTGAVRENPPSNETLRAAATRVELDPPHRPA